MTPWRDDLSEVTAYDCRAFLKLIDFAMRPLPVEKMTIAITQCLALTRSVDRGPVDSEALIVLLTRELKDQPADAVQNALEEWPRKSPWRPALAELLDEVSARSPFRQSMRRLLTPIARGENE